MKNPKIVNLLGIVRNCFQALDKNPSDQTLFKTSDFLMSALALFHLKYQSLLKFETDLRKNSRLNKNLKKLYEIDNVPCDTYLREGLDKIDPQLIMDAFKKIVSYAQKSKVLEEYVFANSSYLLAIDGTSHFSSKKIHCKHCCTKHHKNGSVTYHHDLLCSVIVHPNKKQVIPLAPEFIINEENSEKNNCEMEACKRLLKRIRKDYPKLKLTVLLDSLYANEPIVSLLKSLGMSFIIRVKPGNNKYLFEQKNYNEVKRVTQSRKRGTKKKYTVKTKYQYYNNVSLNLKNHDLKVNFLKFTETKRGKSSKFSWITDIPISDNNVTTLALGGRTRWRIENETFNTLKNQGYNFEHNFGHGKENLCSVFALLMMLAFFIDQLQELMCKYFKKFKELFSSRSSIWSRFRLSVECFDNIRSWLGMYLAFTKNWKIRIVYDSS